MFYTGNSFKMTVLTQFDYFSHYCEVTGSLVVEIAHHPVTI